MITLKVKLRILQEDGIEHNIRKEYEKFSLDDIIKFSKTLWCKYGDHRLEFEKDDRYIGLIDVWDVNDHEYINVRFTSKGVSLNGLRYNQFSVFEEWYR